ncbi:MAG: response regulator transcription factor [Campylobacterota bacterium]|nr:response regulator transcription factor [Campylobacterota bacterium]
MIEDISILIAEDEVELREYLGEYIRLFFKHVSLASCGHDAYMRYLDKQPDIILADINMPNLDGLSMISRIRERDSETKIIVMSAHSEKEKLLYAIELHLVTYLVKPIKTDEIKKILFDIVDLIRSESNRIYFSDSAFWDKKSHVLYIENIEIELTQRESMLVAFLCSKPNQAFSAENIFYHLFANQSEKEFSPYAITSLIKRLRNKLPEDLIQNEYASGYKIVKKI